MTSAGRRQRSQGYGNQMLDPTSEFAPADPMPPDIAALRDSTEPVWVFAYGSLMWDPDVPRAETETALLRGYHRSFCLYSYDYRGTRTQPGLTLGLDHGGACRGIAMRLSPAGLGAAIDRSWAPEMTRPGFTTCGCCRCGPPMARARPSPSRCAAAIRIMPAGCRLTRVRGSSPMPPAGGRLRRLSRRYRASPRRARYRLRAVARLIAKVEALSAAAG